MLEEVFKKKGVSFFEEVEKYGFVFDFQVENNLIEVQGDYFHCNPETKHREPKSKMQIKNTERDKRKRDAVKQHNEYKLVELWENDIINNKQNVLLWIENLKK